MTEKTNVDTSNLEGAGGNQPPVSQEPGQSIAGAPQGSQEFLDLKRRLDLTEKELRGLQSRQDKATNETQRLLDDIKSQMADGKSFDEAQSAVLASRKAQEKDDLLYKIAQKVGVLDESSQTPPAGNGTNATGSTAQVLSETGLDANTPEVIDLIAKYGSDPVKFAVHAGELKARRANSPQPSAAASPSLQAPPSGGSPSVEKLTEDYQKDMLAARGKPAELKAIKEKARKQGVPVDSIVFH